MKIGGNKKINKTKKERGEYYWTIERMAIHYAASLDGDPAVLVKFSASHAKKKNPQGYAFILPKEIVKEVADGLLEAIMYKKGKWIEGPRWVVRPKK